MTHCTIPRIMENAVRDPDIPGAEVSKYEYRLLQVNHSHLS